MPELVSLHVDSSLPQNPPQSPTTPASPAIPLPPLEAVDERFQSYSPTLAGRSVVVELQSNPGDTRAARQKLWETYQREGNNIQQLGLAAQVLERVGLNWRQAKTPKEVIEAFRALPQATTN